MKIKNKVAWKKCWNIPRFLMSIIISNYVTFCRVYSSFFISTPWHLEKLISFYVPQVTNLLSLTAIYIALKMKKSWKSKHFFRYKKFILSFWNGKENLLTSSIILMCYSHASKVVYQKSFSMKSKLHGRGT